MATRESYRNNYSRNFTPEQLLANAYLTIGKERAESLGLHLTNGQGRNMNFDLRHWKRLEPTVGNIMVAVNDLATNSSKFDVEGETHMRHYGGLIGAAGVNMDGQGTLRSTIPCIVIAARKQQNPKQRVAVYESFASLVGGKLKGVTHVEVNPASVEIFESKVLENGVPVCRIAVIQANGLFGEAKSKPFYWSVMQYPQSNFEDPKEESEESTPRTRRTSRSRSRAATPTTTPADDQPGESADMEAMATA